MRDILFKRWRKLFGTKKEQVFILKIPTDIIMEQITWIYLY